MTEKKIHGQVFTPGRVVSEMLDRVGYTADNPDVLTSTVMEPSFGEGAFLSEIVRRLVGAARTADWSPERIRDAVVNNVHGIEMDEKLHGHTVFVLDHLLADLGIPAPETWSDNLHLGDALDFQNAFPDGFDFVVGNPPYVRIHNIPLDRRGFVKQFRFATGTTDLYVVFFELSIGFLKDDGKLAFITPNSFMKNVSQKSFRKHLLEDSLLDGLVDYRSEKIFSDADTYATITYLARQDALPETISYSVVENGASFDTELSTEALLATAGSAWNFADPDGLMVSQLEKTRSVGESASVLYGLATLRDKVFVDLKAVDNQDGTYTFHGHLIESGVLRPVVKASTYKGEAITGRIIFPYVKNTAGKYEPITEDIFVSTYPLAYTYLSTHREELDTRAVEKSATQWFQYGRSQGLSMVDDEKIVFGHVIKPGVLTNAYVIPAGTLVYSGFATIPTDSGDTNTIRAAYESKVFNDYARVVGKDMAGGYKAVSTGHAKAFRFN